MTFRKIKLGQISKVKGGKRLPKGGNLTTLPNQHPYIRVRDMGEKYLPNDNLEFVPDEVFPQIKNYIVSAGNVILSIVGSVGLVSIVNKELDNASLTENCVKILPNESELDNQFLYYFLRSNEGQLQIKQKTVGAVQPKLPIYNINELEINLPPLPTQKAIAEILSSLDDKIELNNQINQNLEALAQTLFKQWFVDFEFPNENGEPYKSSGGEMVDSELGEIPKGWSIVNLDKLLTIKYGKDHKGIPEGQIPIYGSGGIMRFGNKALYEKVSILIPRKGTLTNLFFITDPFWSVDTMFYSEIHSDEFAEFLFFWIKSLDIASMNVGSAVPSMTTKVLNQLLVLKPDENTIKAFHEIVKEIFGTTKANIKENENLIKLRDTLLPKLISGELEINESLLEQTF